MRARIVLALSTWPQYFSLINDPTHLLRALQRRAIARARPLSLIHTNLRRPDQMVVIPEPFYRVVKLSNVAAVSGSGGGDDGAGTCVFPSIRVDNPVTLHVNGLPLGVANLTKAELRLETKSE